MSRHVEPTLRARQLFFLILALAGGLVLVGSRLNELLPALSRDPAIALDQMLARSLIAATASTVLFIVFSIVALQYARRTIQSGQWPPKGMAVPFRTKIREIKNRRKVWAYVAVILFVFAFQIALAWSMYARQYAQVKELRQLIEITPNKNFESMLERAHPLG